MVAERATTSPSMRPVGPRTSIPPTLTVPANVAGPVGGNVFTGQGYVNSGIMPYGGRFVLTIDAPAGTYQYFCLVHGPIQSGTITVVE